MKCLSLLAQDLSIKAKKTKNMSIFHGLSLLLFACVEEGDQESDASAVASRIREMLNITENHVPPLPPGPINSIVILPFSHISDIESADNKVNKRILNSLKSNLISNMKVELIELSNSDAIFSKLAFFDSPIFSKLSSSPNSIQSVIRAWLRIYEPRTILRLFEEEIKGDSK